MAEDLGLSPVWVFGAFYMAMVVPALVGPWAGARIDGFGGRGVLMLSNLVFAAGLALLEVAPSPIVLFADRAVIGLGMGIGLYEAGFATLAGIYDKDARGTITGITLIAGFASTVGWPLSGLMLATLGLAGSLHRLGADPSGRGIAAECVAAEGHQADKCAEHTGRGRAATIPACALTARLRLCRNLVQLYRHAPLGLQRPEQDCDGVGLVVVGRAEGRLCLFVGIDRTSKFAVAQLVEKADRRTALEFLQHMLEAVPYQIHTILTPSRDITA
jgi:hypothetical protein